MSDSFKTINKPAEGYFKDRKSKFYAFAYPVQNEDEVKEIQKKLRKKYYDARHHVYAFVLGKDKKNYRYSDDGEPSNSSGPPILNAIKSFDLTNILVVVIRYFGGKKLGIPGLINAYRSATEIALSNVTIVTKIVETKVNISFPYSLMSRVMYIIKKENASINSQNFTDKCIVTCSIRESNEAELVVKLQNIGAKIIDTTT